MRASSLFWGLILALIGGVLLVDVLDVFDIRFWAVIGPVLLIALGVWYLSSIFFGPGSAGPEEVAIPLAGATRARLNIQPGAGRLRLGAGASETDLLSGCFGGGLDRRVKRAGDTLRVALEPSPPGFWPSLFWFSSRSDEWDLVLNPGIPLALDIRAGAGDAHVDLSGLCVTDLRIRAGAGAVAVILPARMRQTAAVIEPGVAAVTMRVPEGVAARVRAGGGLTSALVDTHRFPCVGGDLYESPDYATAASRVDLRIETGLSVVTVH